MIPPKANRKSKRACDFALYVERNLIERFFQYLKQFRAIATRYEKTARHFLAGLHLVCALAWLKRGHTLACPAAHAPLKLAVVTESDRLLAIGLTLARGFAPNRSAGVRRSMQKRQIAAKESE